MFAVAQRDLVGFTRLPCCAVLCHVVPCFVCCCPYVMREAVTPLLCSYASTTNFSFCLISADSGVLGAACWGCRGHR